MWAASSCSSSHSVRVSEMRSPPRVTVLRPRSMSMSATWTTRAGPEGVRRRTARIRAPTSSGWKGFAM